ncbi:MAG: hypothetical protein AAF907_03835 [Planctomycetota bacterium]
MRRLLLSVVFFASICLPPAALCQDEGRGTPGPALSEEQAVRLMEAAVEINGALDRGELTKAEATARMNGLLRRLAGSNERGMRAGAAERQRGRMGLLEVKDPAGFKKEGETPVFSGPQQGEPVPAFQAAAVTGSEAGSSADPTAGPGKGVRILFFQNETGTSLRGMIAFTRVLQKIQASTDLPISVSIVLLGEDSGALKEQASRWTRMVPGNATVFVSDDGRDGPGVLGLNRNVVQTVLVTKEGKVLNNFAFPQGMLRPDPYLLGAVAEAIGQKPEDLQRTLNTPAAGDREVPMERRRRRD